MTLSSIRDLIEPLYGTFQTIMTRWKAHPDEASHLWELTRDKSVCDILESDIREVGRFFAGADALSARSEIYFVAESIAYLRAMKRSVMQINEQEVETIAQSLQREMADAGKIYTPLSFRVAQLSFAHHQIDESTFHAFRDLFQQYAHRMLVHDGNITPEEDACLREFDAALS